MTFMHKKTFYIIRSDTKGRNKLGDDYFHVDDLIALSVQILNRKGYFTAVCCAGEHKLPVDGIWHYNKVFNKCYIVFEKDVSLPSLPPGFHIEPYEILPSSVCIAKICDTQHEKAMNQLYEWAFYLPEFKNT